MPEEFITFKKFNDPALAEDIVNILKENGIEFTVQVEILSFDPTFASSHEMAKDYLVKLKQQDFLRAEEAINKQEEEQVNEVGDEHYLFAFTNDELTDVIAKADEWSNFDQVLARKILAERGVSIDETALAILNNKRLEDLRTPAKSQTVLVVAGYLFAVLGGAVSIFIGWYLANQTKILPDGEKIYVFNEADRKNRKRIFYLGIIVFILVVAIRIIGSSQ